MTRSPTSRSSGSNLFWNIFPWWFLTLYRQPLVFLGSVLVIPLIAVCLWLYVVNERQWRAREGHDLLVAARLASRIIVEELGRTRQFEEAVAARPEFLDAVKRRDRGGLMSSLQVLVEGMPRINQVHVTDAAGRRLADVAATSSGEASAEAFFDVPNTLERAVSAVYVGDHASGEKVVSVFSPIRDGQVVLGVLHAQYGLQAISSWIEKVRVEPAGFLYVVDHRGRLVAYPFQLLPGDPKDVSGWAPVAAPASPQGELMRFGRGQPKHPWTAAIVSLEPYGWKVVAQQPDAAMLAPFHQLVGSFAVLIAVLAGFIGLLVLRWTHLHGATLRLVAQQARLLRLSQQRHVLARMRRPT